MLAFAMPVRCIGKSYELPLMRKVLNAILNQTDDRFLLVIIDDHSTCNNIKSYLREQASQHPDKILVKFMSDQKGPGFCRNIAIEIIAALNIPIIMFNDSDDVPHRKRVELTKAFFVKQGSPAVLYSSFIPVDEAGTCLKTSQLTPSLSEILQAHRDDPPQGYEVWKDIGTRTGYLNLTSSTSVSTALAIKHQFPCETVSEDSHTWMRYSAGGGLFIFTNDIPIRYRVTTDEFGSSSRTRHGKNFYAEKARVDEDGFKKSIEIALQRNTIKKSEVENLLIGFYTRLAETMIREEAFFVADNLIRESFMLSRESSQRVINKNSVVSKYISNLFRERALV